MKLQPREIEAFLRKPPAGLRAALVFGADAGLVRERAKVLAKTVAPDLSDAFRVVELNAQQLADDPARLFDEAAAISMMGGRRVVMIQNAGDRHAKLFAEFLEGAPGDALIVVEAGELTGRSSLKSAFEEADDAAAIACYADDERSLAQVVDAMMAEAGRRIDADARDYLVAHLGNDRLVTRGELSKLLLYKGDEPGPIRLEDCEAAIGDNGAGALDDAAYAAFGGDVAALTQALNSSERDGESPVAILRVAQKHGQKLHLAAGFLAQGRDPKGFIRQLGVFWKREAAFQRQMRLWSAERLNRALDILTEAELTAKSTGMPAEAACGDALLRIARAARVAK